MKGFKLKIAGIFLTMALGLALSATTVQATPFMGKIDMITGYGLPIPVPGGWVEYGVANVGTSAVPSISLPSTNFQINASGVMYPVWPTSYPFVTSSTFLDSALESGTFSAGAGPGAIQFCGGNTTHLCGVNPGPINQSGTRSGTIQVNPAGPNQFGGSVRLLNQGPPNPSGGNAGFRSRVHIYSPPGHVVGTFPVPLQMVGAPTTVNTLRTSIFSHTTQGWTVPLSIHLQGMPWTTGRVQASDAFGIVSSLQTVTGYDTRTAAGNNGSIQLVTAGLFHTGGLTADDGTFTLKLRMSFVPEPAAATQLGAGFVGLAVLYAAGGAIGFPLLRRRSQRKD